VTLFVQPGDDECFATFYQTLARGPPVVAPTTWFYPDSAHAATLLFCGKTMYCVDPNGPRVHRANPQVLTLLEGVACQCGHAWGGMVNLRLSSTKVPFGQGNCMPASVLTQAAILALGPKRAFRCLWRLRREDPATLFLAYARLYEAAWSPGINGRPFDAGFRAGLSALLAPLAVPRHVPDDPADAIAPPGHPRPGV
jgi:hypothetical protein